MKHRTYLHLKNSNTYFCVLVQQFFHMKNVSFYSSSTLGLCAFVSRDASMVYLIPLNRFCLVVIIDHIYSTASFQCVILE